MDFARRSLPGVLCFTLLVTGCAAPATRDADADLTHQIADAAREPPAPLPAKEDSVLAVRNAVVWGLVGLMVVAGAVVGVGIALRSAAAHGPPGGFPI